MELIKTLSSNLCSNSNMNYIHIILTVLLYAWVGLAFENDVTNDRFLRGAGTRNICIDTGWRHGKHTFEVPKEVENFFTSSHRNNPAKVKLVYKFAYEHVSINISNSINLTERKVSKTRCQGS
jgi:hypothetical protein